VNIPNLYLFVTQYFSNIILDKQDVNALSWTFIPRSDVGNKSIGRVWANTPTAVEEY
jgi:hypothetical protein